MSNQSEPVAIETLEPAPVWRLFAGIAATPRPSKHEGQIRRHLRGVAQDHGLQVREDDVGNMVIEAPASPGCENAPVIVLQGHLDMVPEKNTASPHDFQKDPIRLIVEDDRSTGQQIVRADGTTLGADNGIGIALALAAATQPDVAHGPLELLLTVDEEAGMTGAKVLTPDFFRGRRLLNLDSEEDNVIYMGCAGGMDTTLTWNLPAQPIAENDEKCHVAVTGLRGGHSGGDIHENRGNAIKLLTRTLLSAGLPALRIAAFQGGSKRNVIPREASAVLCGPAGTMAALRQAAETVRTQAIAESYEENLSISVEPRQGNDAPAAMSVEDTRRLLSALAALPSGVLGMHPKVQGLVQTSNNLATAVAEPVAGAGRLRVEVGLLSRSSTVSLLHDVAAHIAAIGDLAGADVSHEGEYPGWDPNPDSPTLAICRRVYERIFAEPPQVMAIHAGLECGIIGQRVGDIDMVSFGPTITGAHSPDERVFVASVAKTWRLLVAVLGELART